jgi:hypothetical protein
MVKFIDQISAQIRSLKEEENAVSAGLKRNRRIQFRVPSFGTPYLPI